MKKLRALLSILVTLLTCISASTIAADSALMFRIAGNTTLIDLSTNRPRIQSAGYLLRTNDVNAGSFVMDEIVLPISFNLISLQPLSFFNYGTMTIITEEEQEITIMFSGISNQEKVWGGFRTIARNGDQTNSAGFNGSGRYRGTADQCDLPCNPLTQPGCQGTFTPETMQCAGFYVDFIIIYGDNWDSWSNLAY